MSSDLEELELASRPTITMRQVAKAAGVSLMTVSLAMRGNPRITEATRARVERAARQLGYRQNPQISKFMNAVRTGTTARYRSTLAIISGLAGDLYSDLILSGVKTRAASLGFGLLSLSETEFLARPTHHQRVLLSRGITGLILLPMSRPLDLSGTIDWEKFSSVSTSYSITAPHIHRIVPHQFHNIRAGLEALAGIGYGRIGMVMSDSGFVQRLNYASSAAMLLHYSQHAVEPIPIHLIEQAPTPVQWQLFHRWLRRYRPDALVTNISLDLAARCSKWRIAIPKRLGLFDLGCDSNAGQFAGIRQHPETIGSLAVDLVASMLNAGERGIPKHPRVTMIEGDIELGRTVCQQRFKSQRCNQAPRKA